MRAWTSRPFIDGPCVFQSDARRRSKRLWASAKVRRYHMTPEPFIRRMVDRWNREGIGIVERSA